ncbi:DUF1934 family protein [Clostridium sp. MCC353]|uniref:DUF1934 domain-containing protein n=1 Tax=Clostridium sp. MCC353 TaxID=2592646 RepID=UPI001C019E1C|nr:DUF1934 domain-containing protein [Clostridium sp. MCC353]MBT9776849.1 DUF1934 family protein [Clostridium sp. MCC353]
MTKDVLISISGIQIADGDNSDVEMITTGDYFLKNGKHYIVYDEVMEGFDGTVKNTIKIHPGCLDIMKKGIANVHMVFEEDKKNIACYATPYGDMMVGINTNHISIDESEDKLKVRVDYSLDINYEHVSECNIVVDVQSRDKAEICLS